ncbi:putative phosphatidate phosphatase isoform X1 [Vespula maculifrons]|uniref:Phosphatidate phosphatase isoform X1 n=1 Tax=Vespula maculifrons TaxID=7453 RepID=A0ABD2BUC8_VESMC
MRVLYLERSGETRYRLEKQQETNNTALSNIRSLFSYILLTYYLYEFVIVSLAVLMFFLFGKPYKRGFFCNDESLMHPYHSSTVTSAMLYVTGLFLPICTMIAGEYLYGRQYSTESSKILFGYTIPPWLWMAYIKVGVFGFGAATTVLVTDVAKYTIGRLRPHFMTLCVPDINCSLPENQFRYIQNFSCTAPGISPKLLKEMR